MYHEGKWGDNGGWNFQWLLFGVDFVTVNYNNIWRQLSFMSLYYLYEDNSLSSVYIIHYKTIVFHVYIIFIMFLYYLYQDNWFYFFIFFVLRKFFFIFLFLYNYIKITVFNILLVFILTHFSFKFSFNRYLHQNSFLYII